MTQIILRHATDPENVESILEEGLIPHRPAEDGNFVGYGAALDWQPRGVYANPINNNGWIMHANEAVFEFPYVGPINNDEIVKGAVVVPERIPPEDLRLLEEW